MTERVGVVIWLMVAAIGLGCTFRTDFDGTRYRCDESESCPDGFTCVVGFCEVEGLQIDGATAPDARIPDAAFQCPDGSDPTTWYRDADGDTYGDPGASITACDGMDGAYVANDDDCNDDNDAVNPGAREVCGDQIDNDCVGGDPCLADLLAHWRFDEGQGDTASDSSGNGHHGVVYGSTWTADGLRFGTIDDYVEVPHSPDFAIPAGTVALWFRTDTVDTAQGIWSKDSSGFDTGGHLTISVALEGTSLDPTVSARLQSVDVSNYARDFAEQISPARWYHVVFVFGPDGMRLRVDNVLIDSNIYAGGLDDSSGGAGNFEPLVMGASTQVSDDLVVTPLSTPLQGEIHDVRFYRRPLDAGEVADLFAITGPGNP